MYYSRVAGKRRPYPVAGSIRRFTTDDGGPGPDSPNRPGSPSTNEADDHVTELPPEIERLLLDVVADGFTVYCCGPRIGPTALAASYEWPNCVDHLTIRSWDRAVAARIPRLGTGNVFEPELVVWFIEGCAA